MRFSVLASVLATLVSAIHAHAVTLVATTDEPMSGYLSGATVTITLTGTTDPLTETAASIDAYGPQSAPHLAST